MPIDPEIERRRLQQQQAQQQQVARNPKGVFRIGDRDPVRGGHELIHPDGSKDPTAIKAYGAAHKPGDPVLAQQRTDGRWVMTEAAGRRQRKRTTSKPMPTRKTPKALLWVLYQKDGALWVGGHMPEPERIADDTLIGWQYPWGISQRRACIWGDSEGWKVSFREIMESKDVSGYGVRHDAKSFGLISSGNDYIPQIQLRKLDPEGYSIGIDPSFAYYQNVLGGGYWELQDGRTGFSYITPVDNGTSGYDGVNLYEQTEIWNHGYWDGGVITQRSLKAERKEEDLGTFEGADFTGKIPLFPGVEVPVSRKYLRVYQGATTDQMDVTRLWFRDRDSAIAVRFVGTEASLTGFSGTLTLSRIDAVKTELLATKFIPPGLQIPGNPRGFYGEDLELYLAYFFEILIPWSDDHFSVATIPHGYFGEGSYGVGLPTQLAAETWYSEGKVIRLQLSDVEMLRFGSREVPISEIAIDGTMTQSTTFGHEIPSDAIILAYCASKL
jgi:hypothetical protein